MMMILFRFVQLIIPTALLCSPFLFYKRKGPRFLAYYTSMAIEPKHRKTFMLILAITVLVYNYTFFSLAGASLWQVPGLILGIALLRYPFSDAMLHWLHEDRVIQGIAFGGILLSLIVPELYSMSTSMALVFTSAVFYPSRAIIDHARYPRSYMETHLSNEDIVKLYF